MQKRHWADRAFDAVSLVVVFAFVLIIPYTLTNWLQDIIHAITR